MHVNKIVSYHIRIKISIIAPFLFVDCTLESIHRCVSFPGYLSVNQVTAGEERVSGEKYYIGERKILNNRKVVDGEPNQTGTPLSVVHNCGRKIFRNGRRLSMCRSDHWGGESLCLSHWCQMLKMTIVISFHILPYLLLFCHIFPYHLMSIISWRISMFTSCNTVNTRSFTHTLEDEGKYVGMISCPVLVSLTNPLAA